MSAPAFASVELELVHFVKEEMAPSTEPVEEQGTVAESLIDDITIKTVAVVFGEHRSQIPFLFFFQARLQWQKTRRTLYISSLLLSSLGAQISVL